MKSESALPGAHAIFVEAETETPGLEEVRALITKCALETLRLEGIDFPAEVDVTLVDDEGIRTLNAQHRDKDAATDVLSFPMYAFWNGAARETLEADPDTGRVLLGDMVLNYARACEQAEAFGHSPARECGFLTVHSVLHLLGYDHEREEADRLRMREREEAALKAVGLTRGD